MLVLILVTMACRSSHGDPLVLRSRSRQDADEDRRRSTTSVLRLGVALGLVVVISGVALGLLGPSGFDDAVLVVLVSGTALPLLCLQDHLRWVEFARGTAGRALLNDSLWTVCSIAALLFAALVTPHDVPGWLCLLLWSWSVLPAVVVAVVLGRVPLTLRGGPGWLRPNRTLITSLVSDFGLTQATAQGATLVIAALSGPLAMAFIRKGQVWMGPTAVATMGLLSALQPILVQQAARGHAAAVRLATIAGLVGGGFFLAYGLVVLALPVDVATVVTGSGWPQVRPFVVPLTLQAAAGMLGGCLGLALRTTGLLQRQVRWRWVLGPASVASIAVVTLAGGPEAGTWALALTALITAGAWWFLLATSDRRDDARVLVA
ncbi:hypothetical protein [Geodermatophilus sp. URMC 64]